MNLVLNGGYLVAMLVVYAIMVVVDPELKKSFVENPKMAIVDTLFILAISEVIFILGDLMFGSGLESI